MVHMQIERWIYKDLRRELGEPQVLVLTGPRQVGKTTLLRALESAAREAGRRTRYFDLEQPADLAALTGGADDVMDALSRDTDLVFVDEFYYLENAGRFFKAIYDRGSTRTDQRVKIVASGSSSVEIHSHLAESLAGRTITYRVFPLSHDEYARWNSPSRPEFRDYLRFGGLPGLAHVDSEERKQRLLADYLATYLFRDIKGLIREENIRAFNHLLALLAQSQGQVVESSRLAGELGLSAPTVGNYLSILDQTYVNFLVPSYHTNLANELKKSRKTYLYDLGVRNGILKDFRAAEERDDIGAIHESYVFLTLRALLAPNMELRFWRTKRGEEVDFVFVKDRQPFPIEVKTHYDENVPPPGIRAFCRRYPRTTQTFTISAAARPTRIESTVTHSFLGFDDVARVLAIIAEGRRGR